MLYLINVLPIGLNIIKPISTYYLWLIPANYCQMYTHTITLILGNIYICDSYKLCEL